MALASRLRQRLHTVTAGLSGVYVVINSSGGEQGTWPSLPAFSKNNFLEHFAGSNLDRSKWAAVTSGTGAVTVTDGFAACNSGPNAHSAAFFFTMMPRDSLPVGGDL